jgi:hypothetical protein
MPAGLASWRAAYGNLSLQKHVSFMFQVTQSWSGAATFSSFNAGSTGFGFQSRGGFGPTTGRLPSFDIV